MACCRRGLGQVQNIPSWPQAPATPPAVSATPQGPCYFVELQGEFLGFRVLDGVLHLVTGAGIQEARGALAACGTPRAATALRIVESAYARNIPQVLYQMVQDRVFTLSFLRTQIGV